MALDDRVSGSIHKYAIKNAYEYGKARVESVLSKVLSIIPEAKSDMAALRKAVEEIVEKVNSMDAEWVKREYEAYAEEFGEEKAEKDENSRPKFVLDGAEEGNFATRFPPEPSGYLHIGHAKVAFLEQKFSEIYRGKLNLYFDDTNPEKEKQEYVDAIKEDLAWLGIKFNSEYYASDSIPKVYGYAKKLILEGKAYACSCNHETIKKNRFDRVECEHRNSSIETNAQKFDDMLEGKYNENEVIVRFKGDMKADNTTLRDPTILRIKRAVHYRQGDKYIVWPTYHFNTPIMDSLHGITDVIRDENYELSNALYFSILEAVGLKAPRMHLEARLNIKNNITSKRTVQKLIKEGKLHGYDDPRLVTLSALRNRGIQPSAIRDFVLRFGMSRVSSTVDISLLLSENKKDIDSTAKRLFYVDNPVEISINNFNALGKSSVAIPLHPTNKDLGQREVALSDKLYIRKDDYAELLNKGGLILKGFATLKPANQEGSEVGKPSGVVENSIDKRYAAVQWLSGDPLKVRILNPMPPLKDDGEFNIDSLKESEGYAEIYVNSLKDGEVIQFERFGFCSKHSDEKGVYFIFISK
ncbi:MAG: glutamate--tRNA ligase [Candidatus Micrarchaeia archaeon]